MRLQCPRHACTIASTGPKLKRHDSIVAVLLTAAKSNGLYAIDEPRNTVKNTRKRPDLFYSGISSLKPTFIDVTVTILDLSTVHHRGSVQGAAAKEKARKKSVQWSSLSNTMSDFLPFAIDTTRFLTVLMHLTPSAYERKQLQNKALTALIEGNRYMFCSIVADAPKCLHILT